MSAITLTFWAVYLQLLKLLFHYVKIISSFKLLGFLISFRRLHYLPARPIRICYMKGKIFKVKNAMVTFISIERSEPKILTWNLHHHSLVKAPKYHNKSNSFQCKLRGAYICEPVTVGAYIRGGL